MNEINNLLSSYSLQEITILTITLLFVAETFWKLVEFFYNKYQVHVGKKIDKREFEQRLKAAFEQLSLKVDELNEQNKQTHLQQDQIEKKLALVQERMQENTRSFLIDAHHKFCYQYHKIDDLNLQSIERHYLYYKTAGGDTFVDNLVEEIRSLPRANYLIEQSSEKSGEEDNKKWQMS